MLQNTYIYVYIYIYTHVYIYKNIYMEITLMYERQQVK